MKHLAMIFVAPLALAACAGRTPTPAEPIITTQIVKVPVPLHCDAKVESQDYPDTDAALRSAPDILERVKLLMAGRTLRMTHEIALEAALAACR